MASGKGSLVLAAFTQSSGAGGHVTDIQQHRHWITTSRQPISVLASFLVNKNTWMYLFLRIVKQAVGENETTLIFFFLMK